MVVSTFLVAAAFSFWGSVLMGLVNTAVIQTALNDSRNKAIRLALGGVLPEIPYSLIPIFFASKLELINEYQSAVGIIIGIILIGYGGAILVREFTGKSTHVKEHTNLGSKPFLKGLTLGSLNPQLIIFWSGIVLLIQSDTMRIFGHRLADLSTLPTQLAFSFGAAFGAFTILVVYAFLATRYKDILMSLIGTKLNQLVGWFFLLFGLFAVVKNVI